VNYLKSRERFHWFKIVRIAGNWQSHKVFFKERFDQCQSLQNLPRINPSVNTFFWNF